LLDEYDLPSSSPFFDAFFGQDRFGHCGVKLGIDQPMDGISLRKTVHNVSLVFGNAAVRFACYPDIERPVPLASEDVNARLHLRPIVAWSRPYLDPRFRGGDEEESPARLRGAHSAKRWVRESGATTGVH
jgi:hypothetical protein